MITQLLKAKWVGQKQIVNQIYCIINTNQDTTETWTLYMNITTRRTVEKGGTSFLSNGNRKILIISTSSNKNGNDTRTSPAFGYEFIEKDKPVGALQYFGGGVFGANKNIVWIHNDQNSKMKLILAAAMTSVLQLKN